MCVCFLGGNFATWWIFFSESEKVKIVIFEGIFANFWIKNNQISHI